MSRFQRASPGVNGRSPDDLSQNHRMFRVGRDPCRSPSQTPLPKQGHLQQAAQDLVQVGNLVQAGDLVQAGHRLSPRDTAKEQGRPRWQ